MYICVLACIRPTLPKFGSSPTRVYPALALLLRPIPNVLLLVFSAMLDKLNITVV
jgi:hypothetical protein